MPSSRSALMATTCLNSRVPKCPPSPRSSGYSKQFAAGFNTPVAACTTSVLGRANDTHLRITRLVVC
eukprot:3940358-Rhodomonas_salina.5